MNLFGLLCVGAPALLILGTEMFSALANQLGRALNEFKRASAGLYCGGGATCEHTVSDSVWWILSRAEHC